MDNSWQTFGHNRVKNILNQQLVADKFQHAYLFSGPEGLGKKMLALEFAEKVLQTGRPLSHSDFQMLDAEAEITMEVTVDFISRLNLKPFLGAKKIAIINNVQNLNTQSGNALLKTLEEPSPSSIIILISGNGKVLPTIASRCQPLNFCPFSLEELKQFALGKKLQVTDDILELSFGSPGRLLRLITEKDFLQQQNEIITQYKHVLKSPLAGKLISINALAELEPRELENNLLTWLFWQFGRLRSQPESYIKVQALGDCLVALKTNKNKKLALQGLMLKI